ncbi:MAG: NAD(P)H-dependent oxidoreductase [Holophagaceae bacterium]|nr:NAD(P)H-dependent oxidoreductase [Holophagaceae bacterium]
MLSTSTAISSDALINQLEWRYATKQFDATRKLDPETWKALEEALVLTPSSYGLQPYKFFVVTDSGLKAKLRPASWGQSQIEDASHLVVFAIKKAMGEEHINRYVERIAQVRGVSAESLEGFRGFMVEKLVKGVRSGDIDQWATRQAYIALGNFMTSAALLGVDACPLEGLEPAAYDAILGLEAEGYATVCACAAGYRSEDDKYAKLPKVRFPESELVQVR